jgi:hypothetical protein
VKPKPPTGWPTSASSAPIRYRGLVESGAGRNRSAQRLRIFASSASRTGRYTGRPGKVALEGAELARGLCQIGGVFLLAGAGGRHCETTARLSLAEEWRAQHKDWGESVGKMKHAATALGVTAANGAPRRCPPVASSSG